MSRRGDGGGFVSVGVEEEVRCRFGAVGALPVRVILFAASLAARRSSPFF